MHASSSTPAGQQSIRRHNLKLVVDELVAAGPLPRSQLAGRTGLTKATVSDLVESLVGSGIAVEHDATRGSVGRPANPIGIDPQGPVGLGVEINVDYVVACIVDLTGAMRFRRMLAGDNRKLSPRQTMRRVSRLVDAVSDDATAAGLAVVGVGIAVPGAVDDDGVLRNAPNLPVWNGLAPGAMLREHVTRFTDTPHVDNEANLAALAELWFGAARKLRDFVYVSGEIGVGAGIVIDGRLFRGVRGFAGELGHVLVDSDGPLCSCGSRGCLEQLAGQEALLRDAGALGSASGSSASGSAVGELLSRARAGTPPALAALERAGRALGIALSNLMNILDIPTVVLGGVYAQLSPWLSEPISEQLRSRVVSRAWEPANLLASQLGVDAAVRGAAGTVVRAILDDPARWAEGQSNRGLSRT